MLVAIAVAFSTACAALEAQAPPAGARNQVRAAHAAVTADTKGLECAGCHKEVMAREVLHGPVAARSCPACHVAPAAGSSAPMTLARGATKGRTAPLCVGCHEELGVRLKEAHVHGPVASGNCISCHDPHGSGFPYFLAATTKRSCLVCHKEVASQLKQAHVHEPAVSCGMCHDPHASPNPSQLRARGNAVCQACHLGQPTDVAPGKGPQLFGRELSGEERPFPAAARRIALDAMGRSGHPNLGHPVAGVPDPNDSRRMLSCVSCHQPHGAAGRPLLQFGLTSTVELCLKCHK